MNVTFMPCQPWHLERIEAQSAQRAEYAANALAFHEMVNGSVVSLSGWIDDTCVAAGGLRPIWQGRMAAWALFSPAASPAMLAFTRKLRFVLATVPAGRIEMTVRADFKPGCKLAWLLGFKLETPDPMAGFFPDGGKGYLFARVKS